MSDLRPCPMCNETAEIEQMGSGRQSMIYHCTNCGCSLETSETFIGPNCSWNPRASDAQAEKLADLLRKAEGVYARIAHGAYSRQDMNDRDCIDAALAAYDAKETK